MCLGFLGFLFFLVLSVFIHFPLSFFNMKFSIYLLMLVSTPVPQCTSGGHRGTLWEFVSPFTVGCRDQAQVIRFCSRSLCLWSQLKEASAWTSSVKQMGDLRVLGSPSVDPMIVSHERSSVLDLYSSPLCGLSRAADFLKNKTGPSPVWMMSVISRKEKAEHCFISSLT